MEMEQLRERFYVLFDEETGNYLSDADSTRFMIGRAFDLTPSIFLAKLFHDRSDAVTASRLAKKNGNAEHGLAIGCLRLTLETP